MPSSSIENRIGVLTPTTSERVPSRRAPLAGEPRPSGKRCAPSSLLPPSGGVLALRGSALPLHERGPLQARFCTRRPELLGARPVALRV